MELSAETVMAAVQYEKFCTVYERTFLKMNEPDRGRA